MELGQVDFMLLTIRVRESKRKEEDLLLRGKHKSSKENS